MQVSEKDLALPQQRIFFWKRLLYLHDHLPAFEDILVRGNKLRTGRRVFLIGITRADARARADNDLMTALDEQVSTGRQQADSIFLRLHFFWNSDDHCRNKWVS